MAIEIVSFPINSMVIFHSFLINVYQLVDGQHPSIYWVSTIQGGASNPAVPSTVAMEKPKKIMGKSTVNDQRVNPMIPIVICHVICPRKSPINEVAKFH